MTPDDEARLRPWFCKGDDPEYEREYTPQPRQNVIFEGGMAMAVCPERTILVELGNCRPFSDIAGHHILVLDNAPERRRELVQRLETTGCQVNTELWQIKLSPSDIAS
jgi:predicted nucleotide-binding protein